MTPEEIQAREDLNDKRKQATLKRQATLASKRYSRLKHLENEQQKIAFEIEKLKKVVK